MFYKNEKNFRIFVHLVVQLLLGSTEVHEGVVESLCQVILLLCQSSAFLL